MKPADLRKFRDDFVIFSDNFTKVMRDKDLPIAQRILWQTLNRIYKQGSKSTHTDAHQIIFNYINMSTNDPNAHLSDDEYCDMRVNKHIKKFENLDAFLDLAILPFANIYFKEQTNIRIWGAVQAFVFPY